MVVVGGQVVWPYTSSFNTLSNFTFRSEEVSGVYKFDTGMASGSQLHTPFQDKRMSNLKFHQIASHPEQPFREVVGTKKRSLSWGDLKSSKVFFFFGEKVCT